jgi:phosphoribosylformimino-5-aminoimidazole carboxamide ribotide isomerase
MKIIPAIDIRNGKVVRLYKGNYKMEKVYSSDPILQAEKFKEQGAEIIHLVDLDGAKEGKPINYKLIKELVLSVKVDFQVGGGIRSRKTINKYLDVGIKRVILGSVMFSKNKKYIKSLCKDYKGKIVFSLDVKDKNLFFQGWTKMSKMDAYSFAKEIEKLGAKRIIYTDISRDGTLKGVKLSFIQKLNQTLKIPLIVAGGISSFNDIKNLFLLDIEAVIVGKAIYERKINLINCINFLRKND